MMITALKKAKKQPDTLKQPLALVKSCRAEAGKNGRQAKDAPACGSSNYNL